MRDGQLVSIELLVSFRADGSMFWLDTSYMPGGEMSRSQWKGAFLVTYVNPQEFELLMRLETADVLWTVRVLGPDSLHIFPFDLRLDRK